MGTLAEIRDNNIIQPNRMFRLAGDVKYIEIETEYTKIIISVFDYYKIGEPLDNTPITFKGNAKKIADKIIKPKLYVIIEGDLVFKDNIVHFWGKIIEVYKSGQYFTEENVKNVDKNIGYDKAY